MPGNENVVPGDPKGCVYRAPDEDIYFNDHSEGGSGNTGRRTVCTKKAPVGMHKVVENTEVEAAKLKIFCWAWTPMRPSDELLLPEVRTHFLDCDGYTFYTARGTTADMTAARDVVQIDVPEQTVKRTSPEWLYHRNMVGVLPSWKHLLREVDLTPYHWIVHLELDHFVHPGRLRQTIYEYIHVLHDGSQAEKKATSEALMLMFGNAFLFNVKMIQEMQRQWTTLGKAADDSTDANGCPMFMEGGTEWPLHCSQDMAYPALVNIMKPPIKAYGRSGCGQFDATNSDGTPFPAGCWEMQKNPFGQTEAAQLDAVSEMAKVQSMGKLEIREFYKMTEQEKNWDLWWHSTKVPIIHHVSYASVHKFARDLLKGPAR